MHVQDVIIPSYETSRVLQGRLYSSSADISSCTGVAVVAHPYGPLGGSHDDPVVVALAQALTQSCFLAATFNFGSPTSWRCSRERADYLAVLKFALDKVSYIKQVVCCGYSYGTLCLPPLMEIRTLCASESVVGYILVSPLLPPVSTLLTLSTKDAYTHIRESAERENSTCLAIFGDCDQFTSHKRLDRAWQGHGRTVPGADHFWRGRGQIQSLVEYVHEYTDALTQRP
ncbi:Alpha/Beta hydrolase protein [Protomyces lactucae-debilis]|uniref:Alpha/Beta hydrolase protein n=1 Tax=Protomyces lactucae-debilis TaxID=2754530 RepID=A0A1Y2FSM4_PROLT|nr:Alpha/Beta hydrolase protein [Protomyces lactucae-debilis]ORY86314.1 Alpha/Beta hydrolase protein [Protomyces lactucae-debilis]